MLRWKQEQQEAESEVARARRNWGWFRKPETSASPVEQTEVEQAETDEIKPRLTALQQAIARRKKSFRTACLGAAVNLSGIASVPVLPTWYSEYGVPPLWISAGLILGGEALGLMFLFRGEKALRAAVNALAHTDDLRAVGPLAEALPYGEPSYSIVVSILTRLLPRLRPSDAELLTPTQRACLQRALNQSSNRLHFWRYNPHFAAVLKRALTTLDALPSSELTAGDDLTGQQAPQVEALLEQFEAAVRQRQKNMIVIGGSAVLAATSALGNIVVQMGMHQPNMLLPGVAISSVSVAAGLTFRGLSRLKAMMNELAYAGDLRIVGPLIEIAAIQDGTTNTMAALLLTRLLPRLQASDASLLTDKQHVALGQAIIRNSSNLDFLIAILKMLEQVGDGRVLPVVESLAAGKIATADPKRVQAAARECLPFLQIRCDQQRASQTLLRASGISETPTDTLLRPAEGVVATNDAELLRPGIPRPDIGEEEIRRDTIRWISVSAC